jgi:hypothetical protein
MLLSILRELGVLSNFSSPEVLPFLPIIPNEFVINDLFNIGRHCSLSKLIYSIQLCIAESGINSEADLLLLYCGGLKAVKNTIFRNEQDVKKSVKFWKSLSAWARYRRSYTRKVPRVERQQ